MHLGMSLGNISFPRYEASSEKTIADFAPEVLYASTDLMNTGNAIVQVVGSNGTTAEMTEAQLYGSTYSNFVTNNGTTKICKIYNQGTSNSPSKDLSQDVSANQPIVDVTNKRFIFDDAFVYSPEINFGSGGQGTPSITANTIFFASKIHAPAYDANDVDQGEAPLLSIYNASSGGPGLTFGFSHTMHHRQLTYRRTSTQGVFNMDDSGGTPSGYYPSTTTKKATFAFANNDIMATGENVVWGKSIGTDSRSIWRFPSSITYSNTDDTGDFDAGTQSGDKLRWGIGGYKVSGTTKDIPTSFSLKVSMAFDRDITINSDDYYRFLWILLYEV